MNKLLLAPMLLVVFLSGCVGQPSATYTTTTTTPTTSTTLTTPTATTTSTTTITTPTSTVETYSVQADDSGFYPSSTITVKQGNTIQITFTVRTSNVYYGGLRIAGGPFDTGAISPGGSKTVSFTAGQSFSFTSYWPSTSVTKATGQVVVQ